MRLMLLLAASTQAIRILLGNDDGWAGILVRHFHHELVADGHKVILSAPRERHSGKGDSEAQPQTSGAAGRLGDTPENPGTDGHFKDDPTLRWVNSFPVTAIRYGLEKFAPALWHGADPELVLSGINLGSNSDMNIPKSATVAVAAHAARQGFPAVALSAEYFTNERWDAKPVPEHARIHVAWALEFVRLLIKSGTPYLPKDTLLNINLPSLKEDRPAVDGEGKKIEYHDSPSCENVKDIRWVFTRARRWNLKPTPDMELFGDKQLPADELVVESADLCLASVTLLDANTKATASKQQQEVMYKKLKNMLEPYPDKERLEEEEKKHAAFMERIKEMERKQALSKAGDGKS